LAKKEKEKKRKKKKRRKKEKKERRENSLALLASSDRFLWVGDLVFVQFTAQIEEF
jgi:hypothetical protein